MWMEASAMKASMGSGATGIALRSIPEQAAAVCFRRTPEGVEFLLVRTGAGKWTFPKGRVETGETLSAAAGREALEEAGVRGRHSPVLLTTYRQPKLLGDGLRAELTITTFLLHVASRTTPREGHRAPRWFSSAAAADALRVGRSSGYSAELVRVVERAALAVSEGVA